MAMTKVVDDPITRIEGHLRIEVQADQGKITNSWASSTQFRGIEIIMEGRDPRPPKPGPTVVVPPKDPPPSATATARARLTDSSKGRPMMKARQ
jgi:hypothetical protein